MSANPLKQKIEYPKKYDPKVLYPIPRGTNRKILDIDRNLKMYGIDHWRAYEISWLDLEGSPVVRLGEFFFSANSKNIIESKSLKLYLNSLNSETFAKQTDVENIISADLSAISHSDVKVVLHSLDSFSDLPQIERSGRSVDHNQISIQLEEPAEELLKISEETVFDEELYSDHFRSNCPITRQPDWASFYIQYTGPKMEESSLLDYLCSYRSYNGYHEECAERIFRDIYRFCRPADMKLSLNFLRRGGIDINIYRSTKIMTSSMLFSRLVRQ
ncbi:MAG: NADPH-dependent 7-cyano-7-deazaguanine reductase QueF [Gammaproteobacteria bacterium]|nr:NADPH-dependent 7-cyano-7-deazaguanine reductase QueF [Gammaproteobacteria bacterium]